MGLSQEQSLEIGGRHFILCVLCVTLVRYVAWDHKVHEEPLTQSNLYSNYLIGFFIFL